MAIECSETITQTFNGYLSEDWMFYCCSEEISLYDYNPSTQQLEFVGVCGNFVFLKTLVQQRIAIAIKDSLRPLLFIFREIDPLCTLQLESYTITFNNNGNLFSLVFIDDEICKQCFGCIQNQVTKHFNKYLKRTHLTPEEARNKTIKVEEVADNAMIFGSDKDKIQHYLNCTLPYYCLPNPFKRLGVPQTVSLDQALPPEIRIPDPKVDQRHGMGINPPIIPIQTLQEIHHEITCSPDNSSEQDTFSSELASPRKVSRMTVSELKIKSVRGSTFDTGSSRTLNGSVLFPRIPISPRSILSPRSSSQSKKSPDN
ncbi:hypothetical protein EDI_185160 [Entamoeba dispar SAW760]|uniref:Uncharacterized protein n=1 Tax=Entamoeba dispar (strain ATCC PRA-260 / SAW760) TaxID=370354 RepID=B0ER78_ENTDS|nr:uncharacterized protein EDI_185160 [Entamoeba dispar SAW760]EDR22980.1 hypothetical protein EDI_185160 [Entamoeba dispar SAW760]|eukprot:EDR22980.1 hypothetical protein EDI_185160 [Entamoeba dispar SAW760]